jgi:hypothetical protein
MPARASKSARAIAPSICPTADLVVDVAHSFERIRGGASLCGGVKRFFNPKISRLV